MSRNADLTDSASWSPRITMATWLTSVLLEAAGLLYLGTLLGRLTNRPRINVFCRTLAVFGVAFYAVSIAMQALVDSYVRNAQGGANFVLPPWLVTISSVQGILTLLKAVAVAALLWHLRRVILGRASGVDLEDRTSRVDSIA